MLDNSSAGDHWPNNVRHIDDRTQSTAPSTITTAPSTVPPGPVPPGPSDVPMPDLDEAPDAANALLALCDVAHGTVDVAEGSQALVTVGNQDLVSFPGGGDADEVLDSSDDESDVDPDQQDGEEDASMVGEGYIYDDPTLQELMSDRYRILRDEVIQEKINLLGTVTTVGGHDWRVRPDITPAEIGIPEGEQEFDDYMEIGVRTGGNGGIPKHARRNDQVRLGRRASPRHKTNDKDRCEGTEMFNIFLTLYPVQWRRSLLRLNEAIDAKNKNARLQSQRMRNVTQSEYWRFNGMLLLCAVTKTGGIEGLYKTVPDGIVKDVKGEEYMHKKRLKEIKNVWVTQFHAEHEKETNGWWKMSRLETGFNTNRQRTCASSFVKTMDESMSSYRPQKNKTGNLPNISYIQR